MSWWKPDIAQTQEVIIMRAVDRIAATPSGACFWVQGCAGTGKTLVLVHIARRLLAKNTDYRIIFLTYTHALKAMIQKTVSAGKVHAEVSTYLQFLNHNNQPKYDLIFLDEIQDISREDLLKLKSRCKHLIAAGDCEQSIYENANSEEAIDEVIQFEKSRLIELFRITGNLVKAAQAIMPWTKMAEREEDSIKRNVTIAVRQFSEFDREAHWVYSEAKALARSGSPSVILFPNHQSIFKFCRALAGVLEIASSGPRISVKDNKIEDYDAVNEHFKFHNIPVQYLGNRKGDLGEADTKPVVFVMTYHSAKGLDFDNVFLPLLHSKQEIVAPWVLAKMKDMARILFFVAITRTRDRLIITYTGNAPHPYVQEFPQDVVSFVTDNGTQVIDDEEEEELF
jgi:superfamily I DNA/RNA helicase